MDAHLALCPRCREVVSALVANGHLDPSPHRARRRGLKRILAAASLLLLLSALLYLLQAPPRAPAAITDRALLEAARRLEELDGDTFQGFLPLSKEERLTVVSHRKRGGVALLAPASEEVVLTTRPQFRWWPVPGIQKWSLRLSRADGTFLWEATCPAPSLEYPPQEPPLEETKRYLWEVSAQGHLGPLQGSQVFSVAPAQDRNAYLTAERSIREHAPAQLQDLLLAHLALRRKHLAQAETLLRGRLEVDPEDRITLESLYHLLHLQNSPETESLEPLVKPAKNETG